MNQKKTITIAKLTDLKSNYKKRSTSQIGKSIDSVTKVISRVCTWSYRKRERFLPCDLSRQRRQRRGTRRRGRKGRREIGRWRTWGSPESVGSEFYPESVASETFWFCFFINFLLIPLCPYPF